MQDVLIRIGIPETDFGLLFETRKQCESLLRN
jgi:hypothetical protein